MATATPTTPGPTTITSIPSSFCPPRLLLSHEDSERYRIWIRRRGRRRRLLPLPPGRPPPTTTTFSAVVRELDSQGVVKLHTSPALAATAASAVELVPRGEDGDGDTYNHRPPTTLRIPSSTSHRVPGCPSECLIARSLSILAPNLASEVPLASRGDSPGFWGPAMRPRGFNCGSSRSTC